MDAIHLQDLAFYAYHGVHAEEARLGQREPRGLWLEPRPLVFSRADDG